MIKIDLQSRVPLYEQLKGQIIKLSMLGVLDENEKLPSVRSLAREVGINPNTVQKAYQDLERDGIIYTVSGKGSFVSQNAQLKIQLQHKALDKVEDAAKGAFSCGCSREEVIVAAQNGCINQTNPGENFSQKDRRKSE